MGHWCTPSKARLHPSWSVNPLKPLFSFYSFFLKTIFPFKRDSAKLFKLYLGTDTLVDAGMSEILRIEHVRKYFGRFAAVDDISIGLKEGGIYLLVGPNGCGKSTLTNCISGLFHPEEGHIYYRDQDITKKEMYEIARMGLVRTFQIASPFLKASPPWRTCWLPPATTLVNLFQVTRQANIDRQRNQRSQKSLRTFKVLGLKSCGISPPTH